jgi:plastocyanin
MGHPFTITTIARNACIAAALAILAAAAVLPAAAAQAAATQAAETKAAETQAAETQAPETEVKIDNFTFAPQSITVKAGTTVTWTNDDDIPHTVAAKTKLFKSKALDTGDKFSFTFTTPGAFEYFCSLHPHMTATIVVEAATGGNAAP